MFITTTVFCNFNTTNIYSPDTCEKCNFINFTTLRYFISFRQNWFLVNPVPKTYNVTHYTPLILNIYMKNHKYLYNNTPWSTFCVWMQGVLLELVLLITIVPSNARYFVITSRLNQKSHFIQKLKVKHSLVLSSIRPWSITSKKDQIFSRTRCFQVIYIILVKVLK